ncbi:ADP-ribosylglycohydrolase family protein [Tenacibaculum sp. M341]|uniref:ADP-ribosylglycohydrolase family protein n=1 Tax=Tenacibaculum sp. M341 TaxID=2530339 RepID=UPI0010533220|nr:ADP-ribosylglycohydrolase family protein [Tenacibaculum sp. M341]TCI95058.1 ADP-ribosylglycohydrolase family protein [Tenacibaculum sp. M341]
MKNKIEAMFLGLAIGDALGVPVEFKSRYYLNNSPVTDMLEFGSHHQPKGTWSDDSFLTFCLADSLCNGYSCSDIANTFAKWYTDTLWTAHGEVFDIGIATNSAIHAFIKGTPATLAGGDGEFDNGNGSLMRISPIAFYVKDKPIEERFAIVKDVSSITHRHIRSVISCFIYVEFLLELLKGIDKIEAYKNMITAVNGFLYSNAICSQAEIDRFHRVLENKVNDYDIEPLRTLEEKQISGSGYVLNTLEASIWCFLTTNSYTDSVLKAVNLGEDTDTTACVTGALSGLYYGIDEIPEKWKEVLVKKEEIIELSHQFAQKMEK